ncbi:MAG: OmpA family protein [Pseudomonadota bacterium]
MVEDALRVAKIEADSCALQAKTAVPVAAAAAPLVAAAAPAAVAPVVIHRETYVLLTDTLFKFDRSGADDMLPGGLQRLADVARRLKSYKSIQTLTVFGHTDRMGSDEYNDKLSDARAKTVQAYLQSLGVKSETAVAQGKGKREPATRDCSSTASREQQIICLQPDRRVTIEVTGAAK